jgi:hypothetical protein
MRAIPQRACWIIGFICHHRVTQEVAPTNKYSNRLFFVRLAAETSLPSVEFVPAGQRVPDIDQWIRFCSNSLQQATGKTLYEEISDPSIQTSAGLHNNERYAVLSHGTQDDPIYNYFNRAALLTFQYPEDEVYSIPSRYSAPAGPSREEREQLMKRSVQDVWQRYPKAVRQGKNGDIFQLTNVLLWNVYDDDGNRVGQAALFDRDKIIQLAETLEQ